MKPAALTVAGTDPVGGAGVQSDILVMERLGVRACSAVTAVLAQNTQGVRHIEIVPPAMVGAQIRSVLEDLKVHAVKIGMLGSAENVREVAGTLEEIGVPVVADPVSVSSSGTRLLLEGGLEVYRKRLLPRVDLLTPNIREAGELTGIPIRSRADVEAAARAIVSCGARSVIVKGGHAAEKDCSSDFWTDGDRGWWLHGPRWRVTETHGSGCVFSAAAASALALGYSVADALVIARAYVSAGLRRAESPGGGRALLYKGGWPSEAQDLPWISMSENPAPGPAFPRPRPEDIRFYPIAADAEDARELYQAGARLVQIRIKKLRGAELMAELRRTVEIARSMGRRVIVNDYWEAALELKADGVHLGQDDLEGVDFGRLARSGMLLGISARNYFELARGWNYRPSYFGIGAVFPTPSKQIDYQPMGLTGLQRLAALSPVPVVAIGGITLERAAEVYAHGADGIAVISDVARGPGRAARVARWLEVADRAAARAGQAAATEGEASAASNSPSRG